MQAAYFITFFFVAGIILGSFINAWVDRLGTGQSVFQGRSKCMSCSVTLEWYELVPLLSFAVLRGKCRTCKSRVPFKHPIIELLMGFLFVLLYLFIGFELELVFLIPATSLLVGIIIYDIRHMIIPNVWVYTFIILSFTSLFIDKSDFIYPSILDILAGFILFGFFAFLWLVSRGAWMGFGDAKLALGMGWFLGLEQGIMALMYAFWAGALYSLVLIGIGYLQKKENRLHLKSLIPFAPFLILGFFLSLFIEHSIIFLG